ncbi:MAG: hypothetical protein IPN33_18525 [Saprospiraceae bacterium]|nr:hypothetical protein [Saprospiraceae bacterium]
MAGGSFNPGPTIAGATYTPPAGFDGSIQLLWTTNDPLGPVLPYLMPLTSFSAKRLPLMPAPTKTSVAAARYHW